MWYPLGPIFLLPSARSLDPFLFVFVRICGLESVQDFLISLAMKRLIDLLQIIIFSLTHIIIRGPKINNRASEVEAYKSKLFMNWSEIEILNTLICRHWCSLREKPVFVIFKNFCTQKICFELRYQFNNHLFSINLAKDYTFVPKYLKQSNSETQILENF